MYLIRRFIYGIYICKEIRKGWEHAFMPLFLARKDLLQTSSGWVGDGQTGDSEPSPHSSAYAPGFPYVD